MCHGALPVFGRLCDGAAGLPGRLPLRRSGLLGKDLAGVARLCRWGAFCQRDCFFIARYEAIHRRMHKGMDCHGAARLAMTDSAARLAGTDSAARLAGTDSAARLAGTDSAARLAGTDSAARLAGADSAARLAETDSAARLAGTDSTARLAGADSAARPVLREGRRLALTGSESSPRKVRRCEGFFGLSLAGLVEAQTRLSRKMPPRQSCGPSNDRQEAGLEN